MKVYIGSANAASYFEMLGIVVSCIAANALSAWFRQQLAPINSDWSQDKGAISQQDVRAMLPLHKSSRA